MYMCKSPRDKCFNLKVRCDGVWDCDDSSNDVRLDGGSSNANFDLCRMSEIVKWLVVAVRALT